MEILVLLAVLCTIYGVSTDDSDIGLNTFQMIENHGYPAETHYIETEDGYILTFQRIPHGKNSDKIGPPVLLMHGMSSSSADWVNMGTNRSLSYLLSDLGYDVWIGNSRGNSWSSNHTTLDVIKDGVTFYNFSWHEMGYYDLPAAVDHILEMTGVDQLQYIGHSQGCTQLFVFLSTRPEYNDKIKLASLMGPAAIFEYHPNEILKIVCKYIYDIEALLKKYKLYDIPYPKLIGQAVLDICGNPQYTPLCGALIFEVMGADWEQFDTSFLPVLLTNLPSNLALKQLLHYGQSIKNGGFSQYDYGTEKNVELYGTERPPAYDLSKITAPIAMYYGKNDGLVHYMDVGTIIGQIPNVVEDYLVPFDNFNHIDFITAIDVVDLLYNEVINVMQAYE